MDIYEVVTKLIGEINPVGETNEDNQRYINLIDMTGLVDRLLTDIDRVAMRKDSHMSSVQTAGKHASDFFTQLGIED